MRNGASAVQHLLSHAALGVLKHAVTEARRRGHQQVQPLHVVSMLLTHAGSRLRQACMLSHHQNAQTAECRALEVCFNVALDHFSQSAMAPTSQPILSNALMAALKRAHAQQRRGCPEHQHSPLLAVKVEIDQLIISILDDPCVSRVMKEAGFSSTNVKCNLEDGPASTVTAVTVPNIAHEPSPPQPPKHAIDMVPQGGSFYDNSCVVEEESETKSSVKMASTGVMTVTSSWQHQQQQSEVLSSLESDRREAMLRASTTRGGSHHMVGVSLPSREDDIRNVVEILLAPRNRNALLIGDTTVGANCVVEDLAFRIKSGAVPAQLQGLQFLDPKLCLSSFSYCSSLEIDQKLIQLSKIVDECMPAGAILHIGDLQWLVEPMQLKKGPANFCPAQRTATELRKLLIQHANNRLWFVGVVTPHTFTRLQVLYPSLANEWNLQPVQVTTTFQPPPPTFLQRLSSNLQTVNDQQALNSLPVQASSSVVTSVVVQDSRHHHPGVTPRRFQCCPDCLSKFEEERRQIHENESLSLQLAPIKWLPSNDEVTSGSPDGAMSQIKNPSVVQQLAQLQQKWQKICRSQHGEPAALVSNKPPLPSPLSRLSASSHSKPCGLGLDIGSRWSSPQERHLGSSSVVDQPLQTPPMFMHSARDQTASPLQSAAAAAQRLQETSVGAKHAEATPPAPEFSAPRDGAAAAAAPGDHRHDDRNGASAQGDASSQIQTSLGLGRVNSGGRSGMLMGSKLRGVPAPKLQQLPSPLQSLRGGPLKSSVSPVTSVGASPMASLKASGGRPAWQTQSPLQSLQQRRPVATSNSAAMGRQSGHSLLGRRQVDITKSPSPPPVQVKEVTVDDNLKSLYKGLMERVPWQAAAIAGISSTVMSCRSKSGRFRGQTAKTDTWLLLLGPDAVAKQLIAKALAELVFGGERSLIHLGFADGSRAKLEADDSGVRFRARTPLDRLAEAVRLKPSAVILLEDIDKADLLMRGRIVKAMEIGKLTDSNGREVSFGNTIVVMTSSVGTEVKARPGALSFSETKLAAVMGRAGICGKIKDSRSDKVMFKAPNTKVVVVDYGSNEQEQSSPPLPPPPAYLSPVGAPLPHWVHKRKPDSLLSVELRMNEKRMRSTSDLNLDLKLSTGDASDTTNCWTGGENQSSSSSSSDHCPTDCDNDDLKLLLAQARSALSEKLVDLPEYAVGFEPFDFTTLATEILTMLGRALEIHGPREVALEVDLHLLEYLVTCVWRIPGGHQAFNSWIEDVFVTALSDGRLCGGASVVELLLADVVPELGTDAGVAFPRRVVFDST